MLESFLGGGGGGRRMDHEQKNDKTKGTGLGRKTKGDTKVESNDSPEIPDRGHQTSPASCWG